MVILVLLEQVIIEFPDRLLLVVTCPTELLLCLR